MWAAVGFIGLQLKAFASADVFARPEPASEYLTTIAL